MRMNMKKPGKSFWVWGGNSPRLDWMNGVGDIFWKESSIECMYTYVHET